MPLVNVYVFYRSTMTTMSRRGDAWETYIVFPAYLLELLLSLSMAGMKADLAFIHNPMDLAIEIGDIGRLYLPFAFLFAINGYLVFLMLGGFDKGKSAVLDPAKGSE